MLLSLETGALHEPLGDRCWDANEVRAQVASRVCFYQRQGMARGDRVFLLFGNCLEFFADLLAIWTLGGCPVPVDRRLTPFEIETLARAAKPRFLVTVSGVGDSLSGTWIDELGLRVLVSTEAAQSTEKLPTLDSRMALDDDALILFTSGSTGDPKGVVHTHRSLQARWITLQQSLGIEKYRRTLCLLPTHFGHGLICNCLFPWLMGQDLFILPPFSPEVVMRLGRLIDEHEITFLSSVPSVWRLALKARRPPQKGTLERVFCGSAPLSAHLWREIQAWAGTHEVCNSYGITETGSWVAGTTVPDFEPEDGLIGVPWGAVVRILRQGTTDAVPSVTDVCAPGETGYVWLNTPALMRGYLDRPDLTAAAVSQGWFLTGDIGLIDERGLLYLRGRERDEINKGGMKIYPSDVDAVAERFPAVTDVCCFGIDDSLYGQNIGLAVVLGDENDRTVRELHAWMQKHLASHQLPARWYRIETIPRTSRGKINRAAVAEACTGLEPLDLRRILHPGE